VTIFANPTAQTFASVGTSAQASDLVNLDAPLGAVSKADEQQLHIRYTADGSYDVELPGGPYHGFVWHPLSPYGQGTASTLLTDDGRDLMLALSGSKDKGYEYSELGSWRWSSDMGGDMIGAVAFGMPTPSASVPRSGSASYSGIVTGKSDVIHSDSFDGPYRVGVTGTVNLDFDFGKDTLSGAMALTLNDYTPESIGTFEFRNTVLSAGTNSYSGQFATGAAGDNFFIGQFTGPNAEETIGAWAVPFRFENATHEAFGAWIAKDH
jgi:hypothetical protein